MRRFLVLLLIMISMLVITFSTAQCTKAQIGPILPVDGYVLGGEFSYPVGQFYPYIGVVYDFKNSLWLYQLGGKYKLPELTLDLNYGQWLNLNIHDYYYQKGVEASLISDKGIDGYYKLTVFNGAVNHTGLDAATETSYLYYRYIKSPYLEGTTQVKFDGDVTLGMVNGENDLYYIIDLELPIKFNYFKIYPALGYIKQTGALKPHYDLTYYARGFDYGSRTGTKMASLTLEYLFPLFAGSDIPGLDLLYGSVFTDSGDVFDDFNGFKLHNDVGVGLAINVLIGYVRFDEVLTDEGNLKFVIGTQLAF